MVYKGHDIKNYKKTSLTRDDIGLPPDTFLIGMLANIRPLKGLDVLLKAIAKIENRDISLLVIGEMRDPSVPKLIKELGLGERVNLLGYRTDGSELISLCDASLMPSTRREGLPRAIVESMAQEIPCVVSDVGGLPELIKDGDRGWVTKAADVNSLKEALIEVYDNRDEARRRSKNARDWAMENLSKETYHKKMLDVFFE